MGSVLKILVVVLVVVVAGWFWMARRRIGQASRPAADAARKGALAPQAMVSCAHCGLHLPAADAVTAGDRHYCSAAHRALGPVAR